MYIIYSNFSLFFAFLQKSPINTVASLKWGSYIGSPHLPPPTVVWQEKFESSVASLEASPTGDVFGVGADSFCLMMHSQQKGKKLFFLYLFSVKSVDQFRS